MEILTLVAGFTCPEGQDVALYKQLTLLLVVSVPFIFAYSKLVNKQFSSTAKKGLVLGLISLVFVLALGASLFIGPLIVSSWGCDSLWMKLFPVY